MINYCAVFATLSVAAASSLGLRLHGNSHQAEAAEHVVSVNASHSEDLKRHSLLVHKPQVEHQLVICNAYASPKALEIVHVRAHQSLTRGSPLAYKQCRDFSVPLEEGDQLDFKAGSLNVGTFYTTGLPKSAGSLLLIPNRRSPHAVGVSFQSHAFSELKSPQIAVIDAFRSSKVQTGGIKIIEPLAPNDKAGKTRVEEELNFDSVVAVNPGQYEIALTGTGASSASSMTAPLNAVGSSKYVVMRLGTEGGSQSGKYPQELVVFPNRAARLAMHFGICLLTVVATLLGLRDM